MKRVWFLLSKKQNSLRSAALVLMFMVFASRVLGLVRDRLLAARFAPDELGVYFAAFRLPNLLFELLVMGAFTSAFIPVFTKYISQNKEKEAWDTASVLINIAMVLLLILIIPVLIFTPQISQFLAPGFRSDQISQMVLFTRFMLLAQVLPLLLGNFFTGILQSYNLFLVPALAPVVYNIGILIGIVFLTSLYGLIAPVIGVGIGAVLFMLIQLPVLLAIGYKHSGIFNLKLPGVREVGKLMVPRTLGLAVSQIDTTVDLILATLLGARMVTIFNFAQHLQYLPVGLFGVTIAQAALPQLSRASSAENNDGFKQTLVSALHQVLFFVIPVAILFIVLRIPIVRLVFGASRFDWSATVLTGMTLSMFSLSLFAQSIAHVLVRGFYALYDSKTPLYIGIVTIFLNAGLSVFFIQGLHLPVWSLGLSTSIASLLNALSLLVFLHRRVGGFELNKLFLTPLKMGLAAVATGIMLYIPLKLLDQLVFDTTRTFGLILLTGTVGTIGLSTYGFLSWVFGVGEIMSFIALLKRIRRPSEFFFEPAREVVNGGVQDKVS